jgi:signal transduction histidine kinase
VELRLVVEGEQVILTIRDNGVGLDQGAPADHEGQGLRNMRDRARSADARLLVESERGKGTTVRAQLPLTGEARP